ncbi:MAG: type II toxin-antitoxin system PemK/MazF family toxin [Rhodocyclaceae bacterium]|nr:type II toxin-antitoxin system PemK/MazF family toxin [Rhodocyclaceae bacterium]
MTFRSGDIVLLPFPFTDLSATKRRPALLLKSLGEFGDWLCLPVTTQGTHSASMALRDDDFADGALPHTSWVRVNRPTLLNEAIMLGRLGSLTPEIAAAIHLAMCKAMECVGHAVMEPRIAMYRVEGDE